MSLANNNFNKHGETSFPVFFPCGGELLCGAVKSGSQVKVGFFRKEDWDLIQFKPNKADIIEKGISYTHIDEVRIIKSGWFIFSTMDFYVNQKNGMVPEVVRGKTDKGFAEFLVSKNHLIDNRYSFEIY